MTTIKLTRISSNAIISFVTAAFILPENCWTEHFYAPQVNAQKVFLEKNAGNKAAVEFIANQRHETQLYYKYKEYYDYVFYIGKKV